MTRKRIDPDSLQDMLITFAADQVLKDQLEAIAFEINRSRSATCRALMSLAVIFWDRRGAAWKDADPKAIEAVVAEINERLSYLEERIHEHDKGSEAPGRARSHKKLGLLQPIGR